MSKRHFFKKLCYLTLFLIAFQKVFAIGFKTEQWQTKSGVRVVFYQAKEVPILNVHLAFAAGSAYDGNKFGLSALTSNMLNQGSLGMDASQIAEKIADSGAQFSVEMSRDMLVLKLKTLTKADALKTAIDVFEAIINKPDFPIDAFKREKNQQLLAISQSQESPNDVADNLLFQKLYLNHPYAHPLNGSKETVSALTLNDLRHFYKQFFVGSNAILVLVGAIELEQAHQIADQLTANLDKGQPATKIPQAQPPATGEKITVDFPSSQTVLRLAQISINHHSPDYFPLIVGNYILGGGALTSLLSNEVREKRGLTYSITSQFMPMPGDGPFMISLSTQNKTAALALKITEDTLKSYLINGPSEEELTAAKHFLIGSFPLSLGSNASIANMLLKINFYNLPSNYLETYLMYINRVSVSDIKNAFQRIIHPDKMLVLSVGKK